MFYDAKRVRMITGGNVTHWLRTGMWSALAGDGFGYLRAMGALGKTWRCVCGW